MKIQIPVSFFLKFPKSELLRCHPHIFQEINDTWGSGWCQNMLKTVAFGDHHDVTFSFAEMQEVFELQRLHPDVSFDHGVWSADLGLQTKSALDSLCVWNQIGYRR